MQEIKKLWKKVKLEDIADIIMGQSPKSEFYTENSDDIPFFQGCTEFQELYPIVSKYCSKPTKLAKKGDILMSVRAPVGALNLSNIDCCIGRGLCSINSKFHKNNWFLLYLLKGNLDYLKTQGGGSVYDSINKDTLLNLELLIPENIKTQQKIASILSKYDDLIENNNKRIKILEETAQSIYEEWFVKYNFPGSENIKIIDSGNDDFGMIPEGWEVKKVEEISLIISKGPSLNYVDDKNQGIPVINQKCIRNGEIELNTIQFAEKLKEDKSYCYLEKYDILINSMGTGTLGRVSRNLTIDEKYIIHNCISFVRSNQNKLKQTILYYQIKSKEDYFISLSTGSTGQTTLNIKEIKNVDLIIPDIKTQNNFDNIVIKMFDEIGALKKQNQNLKETRDLLIPRLVSGELDVEILDVK